MGFCYYYCKLQTDTETHTNSFFPFFLEIEQGKSPLFSNTSLADGDGAEHLPHPAGGDAIGKFLPHAGLRKAARSRGGGESPAGMPQGAPAPPMAPSWTAFHFSCSGPEFFFLSFLLKSKLLSFSPCLDAQPSHRHPALSFSLFSSWDFALLHGRDWSYPTISQNHKIFYRETFFFPCSEQDRVKNKNVPDLHSAQVLLTIEERRGRRGRLLHALLTALSLLPRLQHNPGYWVPCDEEPALLQQFIYFLITLSAN